MRTLHCLIVPFVVFPLAAGCGLIQGGANGSGYAGPTPAYARQDQAPTPTAGASTPEVAETEDFSTLPRDAAHPAIAVVLDQLEARLDWSETVSGRLYGIDYGNSAGGRADEMSIYAFAVERAASQLSPLVLKHCGASQAAARLAVVGPIDNPQDFRALRSVYAETLAAGRQEAALAPSSTMDPATRQRCVDALAEVGNATLSAFEIAIQSRSTTHGFAVLAGWARIVEVGNAFGLEDAQAAELLATQLAHLTALAKTGQAPRADRPARIRPAHPSLVRYVQRLSGELSTSEQAMLLSVDISDTFRGDNVALHVYASEIVLRDLVPTAIEGCGATAEAARLRELPRVRDAGTLREAVFFLGGMADHNQPNARCVQLGANLANLVTGDAMDAVRYRESDINHHMYYARGAIGGWVRFLAHFRDNGLITRDAMVLDGRDRLEDYVRFVRRQRRRPASDLDI